MLGAVFACDTSSLAGCAAPWGNRTCTGSALTCFIRVVPRLMSPRNSRWTSWRWRFGSRLVLRTHGTGPQVSEHLAEIQPSGGANPGSRRRTHCSRLTFAPGLRSSPSRSNSPGPSRLGRLQCRAQPRPNREAGRRRGDVTGSLISRNHGQALACAARCSRTSCDHRGARKVTPAKIAGIQVVWSHRRDRGGHLRTTASDCRVPIARAEGMRLFMRRLGCYFTAAGKPGSRSPGCAVGPVACGGGDRLLRHIFRNCARSQSPGYRPETALL